MYVEAAVFGQHGRYAACSAGSQIFVCTYIIYIIGIGIHIHAVGIEFQVSDDAVGRGTREGQRAVSVVGRSDGSREGLPGIGSGMHVLG